MWQPSRVTGFGNKSQMRFGSFLGNATAESLGITPGWRFWGGIGPLRFLFRSYEVASSGPGFYDPNIIAKNLTAVNPYPKKKKPVPYEGPAYLSVGWVKYLTRLDFLFTNILLNLDGKTVKRTKLYLKEIGASNGFVTFDTNETDTIVSFHLSH